MPPKPERVVQCQPYRPFPGGVGGKVQSGKFLVWIVAVDRRWHHPISAGKDAEDRLQSPGRPKGVANHALGAADRDRWGMITEKVLDGPNLCDITKRRGSAVGVDAVDIFQVATCM